MFGSTPLECVETVDVDDDGQVLLNDAILLLGFLFLGDAPPPAPYPECDVDPLADPIECSSLQGECP